MMDGWSVRTRGVVEGVRRSFDWLHASMDLEAHMGYPPNFSACGLFWARPIK